jgi:hypothetical protein
VLQVSSYQHIESRPGGVRALERLLELSNQEQQKAAVKLARKALAALRKTPKQAQVRHTITEAHVLRGALVVTPPLHAGSGNQGG